MTPKNFSPLPWTAGGTFMPQSDNPRSSVWSKPEPGMQSGQIVVQECRDADAPLLAAAPELLSALEEIVSVNIALPYGLLKQARAAIAKARNKTIRIPEVIYDL